LFPILSVAHRSSCGLLTAQNFLRFQFITSKNYFSANGLQVAARSCRPADAIRSSYASLLDILFWKFDLDSLEKDFLLVIHILLLVKYFIYKCKLSSVIPSLFSVQSKAKGNL